MTTSHEPGWRFICQRSYRFIAFGFGAGLAPKAPGTFGTLVALPLYGLLLWAGLGAAWIAALCVPLFLFGCHVCDRTGKDLGIEDYGGIVWDEIVAMLLVLATTPVSVSGWLAAFALFRLFDVLKPWPIRWADSKVGGGFGVMLDDLIAAGFAIVVLQGALWLGVVPA